ncbi:MAG: hypothetical protein RLZZ399_2819 [Verrucomicrobiota bacterium]
MSTANAAGDAEMLTFFLGGEQTRENHRVFRNGTRSCEGLLCTRPRGGRRGRGGLISHASLRMAYDVAMPRKLPPANAHFRPLWTMTLPAVALSFFAASDLRAHVLDPATLAEGWKLAQNTQPSPASGSQGRITLIPRPKTAASFARFTPRVSLRWDERFLYVESNGLPAHPMMIGITAWQQQVPLPQRYTGNNAWRVPLNPQPAREPRSIHNQFLRGAIALAANGIPIFNPQNNRGEISAEIGELDQWGGHCGRADDYHYHAAPLHLQAVLGPQLPIAYALDGYPIYGLSEPDGAAPTGLDGFHGHESAALGYHYHASQKYPYLQGGFHGEVVESEGQVDPQPRANPVRPALQALRGAKITGFEAGASGGGRLSYELNGEKRAVVYAVNAEGSATFEFQNGREGTRREVYSGRGGGEPSKERERRPGGSGEAPSGPAGPDGKGARRNPDPANGPRRPWIQVHGAELDTDHDGVITLEEFLGEARRTFEGYDVRRAGKLTRAEIASAQAVRSAMGGFVKEHADKIDADGDGTITEAEFLSEVRRMFDKLDANRDRKLTPDEWRDGGAASAPEPSRKGPR